MNWQESCAARLGQHLDDHGDLSPPWARFPQFERYTIGWRMGAGEDWLGLWHCFLDKLGPAFEARLAYLRRHPPAPCSWARAVHETLHPDAEEDELSEETHRFLEAQGLIASDIAFPTWLARQDGVHWPWLWTETPETAARHWTRELWFWSRQVAGLRRAGSWVPPQVPPAWRACEAALVKGRVPELDLAQGLRTLAQLLAAGAPTPPWQLGLGLDDFADSFEDDMGYVDAFRLWGMSAFDDTEQRQAFLDAHAAPPAWVAWAQEQFPTEG